MASDYVPEALTFGVIPKPAVMSLTIGSCGRFGMAAVANEMAGPRV